MSKIKAIKINDTTYDIRGQIYFGTIDSTSTATVFTSQISGITEYFDGLTVYLFNNKITTASGITLNINSLGAKTMWMSNSNTKLTTQWAINTGYLLIYNSSRNSGEGGWDWQAGYNTNTDTKVTQAAVITNSGEYPVLLAYSTATTAVTNSVNKTSTLKYNPSTGVLSATKFSGDGSALTNLPGGTDVNVTQNAAITTAGEYPLILANSTATSAVTGSVNKTSSLKYNPNTQVLTTPKIAATTMTGILTCQNNTNYSTKQARNIFIISQGSSLPTGDDGDICLIY